MTDADVLAAILKIIRSRPRLKGRDRDSAEARDLAKYDQIAGLLQRYTGAGKGPQRGTLPLEGEGA